MQTFSKNERLCSKVLIERLVENGRSFNNFPLRISWLPIAESSSPVKIVISVSKRKFKRAVDRNRIKRQIREAYRKEKQKVYDVLGEKKILLMLVYTAKTKIEYKEIEEKIIESMERLSKTVKTDLA
ncbi:MAG TPA: ribonuclease P protein component [Bacteroidia bacterium]|jgi:ribonuclease P protein component